LAGPFFVRSGALSLRANAPATTGVLWTSEEGNVVGVRQAHALDSVDAKKRALRCSRTRPSLGPETRARQSALNSILARGWRWRGRFGIAVGQTCVMQEEPAPGSGLPDECAAHRASPLPLLTQGEVVRDALKQEDGRGHRPCPWGNESPGQVARTSQERLQKSIGGGRSQIRSHAALQKEWR
jgi:hypothetical protein